MYKLLYLLIIIIPAAIGYGYHLWKEMCNAYYNIEINKHVVDDLSLRALP